MNAMDVTTSHEVIRDLGTLVSRDRLNSRTLNPSATVQSDEGSWFARAVRAVRRAFAARRVHRDVAHLSPRLLSDVGLNAGALDTSINARLEQVLAERESMRRNSILRA